MLVFNLTRQVVGVRGRSPRCPGEARATTALAPSRYRDAYLRTRPDACRCVLAAANAAAGGERGQKSCRAPSFPGSFRSPYPGARNKPGERGGARHAAGRGLARAYSRGGAVFPLPTAAAAYSRPSEARSLSFVTVPLQHASDRSGGVFAATAEGAVSRAKRRRSVLAEQKPRSPSQGRQGGRHLFCDGEAGAACSVAKRRSSVASRFRYKL